MRLFTKCVLWVTVLSFLVSCKKENIAENFTGTYTGTAVISKLPDMSANVTYNNCKIIITTNGRTSIQLTVMPDPADPSLNFMHDAVAKDANNFEYTAGGSMVAMTSYKGSLHSDRLNYLVERTGPYGPEFLLAFTGDK